MDKNVEEYLTKMSYRTSTNNDGRESSKRDYNRDVSSYCTSTVVTKISWGNVVVTTRLEEHHGKFL